MNHTFFCALVLGVLLIAEGTALAHTPICYCADNGDNTITCKGGFSDGSSAAGVLLKVIDGSGQVVVQGLLNQESEYTFDKPRGDYVVSFDAGDGHKIEITGSQITQ